MSEPTHRAGADRRRGAVLGLAVGDAAGWPARTHRSRVLPGWTRRLRRELDAFAEAESVTTLPVPFALNQDPTPLRLGPGDDAEWVAWTLAGAAPLPADRAAVHARWSAAVADGAVPAGRIAVAAAVDNLRRGVPPPDSGRRNPHHFDDAAAIRAVAYGVLAASPAHAATLAGWDAEVTHAGDGVTTARAVAAAIATAVSAPGADATAVSAPGADATAVSAPGADATAVFAPGADAAVFAPGTDATAVSAPGTGASVPVPGTGAGGFAPRLLAALEAELPIDQLAGRTLRRALALVAGAGTPAEAVPLLDELVDRVYSYGCAAAQTVPVAAALTAVALRAGTPTIDAILAAAALPSLADSAPALTGALLGAVRGAAELPPSWADRCRRLAGCCDPTLAGVDLLDIVERTTRGQ
jgi:ADP-ribosylglycohydrolase